MKKLVTMREALASPDYFGNYFAGPTWAAWRILLLALVGEALTDAERVVFMALTGRPTEPAEPVAEFWAVIGRRGGKTRAMGLLAAFIGGCCDHRTVLAPGERGMLPILAASTAQAQQAFNLTAGAFDAVPRLRGLVQDRTGDTLRLKSGVDITVRPASFRTIRSITAVSAICDEISFWRSDDSVNPDEEILGALRPSLLTTGGLLAAISSPYAQRGELFKAFRRHYGPDGDPRKLVAKAASLTMNPGLPQGEIDAAYADDPSKASAEYGGEFRRDIEAFVAREVIEAAVVPGRYELPYLSGTTYKGFVDPSGGGADAMTLAIAHRDKDGCATIDAVRERKPPFSPDDVVQEFAALLQQYKVHKVTGDRYAGEWPRERFRVHGITYEVSEKVKSDIYRDVLPLLNSGKVELLDLPRLVAQFCGLERRTARGGKDSIDHARGAHDDIVNAVSGAVLLAANKKAPMVISDEALAKGKIPTQWKLRRDRAIASYW